MSPGATTSHQGAEWKHWSGSAAAWISPAVRRQRVMASAKAFAQRRKMSFVSQAWVLNRTCKRGRGGQDH